jgi:dTDP-4-amino-4,6-dideoxygalactose transaminase
LLTSLISEAPNIHPQKVLPHCQTGYWQYGMVVDKEAPFSADQVVEALRAEGIPCSAHYIGKPIFLCHDALRSKVMFGGSRFPFDHPRARPVNYEPGACPVTEDVLNRMVCLPMTEFFTEEDIHDMATAVNKVAKGLS